MLKDALSRMADVFPSAVLIKGKDYQLQGNVLSIRFSEGLLKGRVKSSTGPIYDVFIDLKRWPKIPGQCSCLRISCKHAAACLYAIQEKENLNPPAHSTDETWLSLLREEQMKAVALERSHDIVYLLEIHSDIHEHKIFVRLALAKKLKSGRLGKKVIVHTLSAARSRHYQGEDARIISSLMEKSSTKEWFERISLRNSELLEAILSDGRAYLYTDPGQKLLPVHPEKPQFQWELKRDGLQYLNIRVRKEPILPLLLDYPWYYDETLHILGRLETVFSSAELKTLLALSPASFEKTAEVIRFIEENDLNIPLPKNYQERKTLTGHPKAVIYFDAFPTGEHYLFAVHLGFDYEGIRIDREDDLASVFYEQDRTLIQVLRNKEAEQNIAAVCQQTMALCAPSLQDKLAAGHSLSHVQILKDYRQESDLIFFHKTLIPKLKGLGWEIEFRHPVYTEWVEADEVEWFSEVREKGEDFFSYQLGIVVDGSPVSIVPMVADLITRLNTGDYEDIPDESVVSLPLPDGRKLKVAMARIKPLLRFVLQYGTRSLVKEDLLLNRYHLMLLEETEQAFAATALRWHGGEKLRTEMRQLLSLHQLQSVPKPKGLETTLRDYQHTGLNWLQFLRKSAFGGILADDMGLGKTVQTLAHLQLEKEEGRLERASLIVAPTSLVGNWFEEAARFTPGLKVLVFHGISRQGEFDDYDLVISTYGLIQRDKSRFVDYPFYYLILDEAQFIKNARAKTTQIIQQIKARHRLCLSGTPLENNLGELWSLFHFLMPGFLGDIRQFRRFFKLPIEKYEDEERRNLLTKRVRPFMLRRRKSEVAAELPPKTEILRLVDLEGPQRDLYEAIRMTMESRVREAIVRQGLNRSHILLLDALLKLRQVCCDPRLLDMPEAYMAYGNSAKLEVLMELLDNLVSENRRVLVFSQFTSMLKLIEERLIQKNYAYLKLTGQTQNRQQLVHTFQEGHTPVFLISLKAGGTGLNLTRADTVIHYDPWWNPAAEDQATDRSHRIGQENPVFVYKLISKGTVEEAILSMQNRKRLLFEGILTESGSQLSSITTEDLEQFFMPLKE